MKLALHGDDAGPMNEPSLKISQDAAIVLTLAETAVPFAATLEDEAERWLRIMRMHGQVGSALQGLGVGEAPLESPAQPRAIRLSGRRGRTDDVVARVSQAACRLAGARGAGAVCTVDILFAVLEVYGGSFERALYERGAERDELLARLPGVPAGVERG